MRTETDKDNDLTGQVDWDGIGLPPVGVICEIKYKNANHAVWRKCKVFAYSNEDSFVAAIWHFDGEFWRHNTIETSEYDFRKLESQQQLEVRERIEAAYALYCESLIGEDEETVSFDEFKEFKNRLRQWLRIVDKTGYRINKDGE
ncbi:TPA: hypothetical protein NIK62_000111 [Vibrio cholerae]|uniref:hypothetical protein n=1 Tax=Vibrio cholerae TaxID=666 RepID=UPI0000E6A403|nr:hypothetical protein [Vibrio cholerae]EGR0073146.1 hypothetical protein [Vibrio cholerae]EJL6764547.1 hypothetical protein [Vibrio cholerae]EJL6959283.1 hypothetical protein [Vibrio cholerae]EKF9465775.1 hypothetical protein [Vibrio cholerae]EMC8696543.1 hypothetical protein [Vibrio cholerae]